MSALRISKSGNSKIILLANKPYEFRCTVEGTPNEVARAKIKWHGPDGKGKELIIKGDDANGNITLEDGRWWIGRSNY